MGGSRAGHSSDGRGRAYSALRCMIGRMEAWLAMASTSAVAGYEPGRAVMVLRNQLMNSSDCAMISPRASARSLEAAVTRSSTSLVSVKAIQSSPPGGTVAGGIGGSGTAAGAATPVGQPGWPDGSRMAHAVPANSPAATQAHQSGDQLRCGKLRTGTRGRPPAVLGCGGAPGPVLGVVTKGRLTRSGKNQPPVAPVGFPPPALPVLAIFAIFAM